MTVAAINYALNVVPGNATLTRGDERRNDYLETLFRIDYNVDLDSALSIPLLTLVRLNSKTNQTRSIEYSWAIRQKTPLIVSLPC